MKKALIICIIFIFLWFSGYRGASAEASDGTLAMVVTDDAYLFSDASAVYPRFVIDKGYFVTVTDRLGELVRVRFMDNADDCPAVEGYVKLSALSFYEKEVSSPYPLVTVRLICDEVLLYDLTGRRPRSVISAGSAARYYGAASEDGIDYVYVYVNGAVGYLPLSSFEPFQVPLTEEYISAAASKEPSSSSGEDISVYAPAKNEKEDAFTVIIAALVIIVALTVLYLVVRPDKNKGKPVLYNDEE